MSGADSELRRASQYSTQIECPQCGKKMILHVGVTGDPQNGMLDCIGCHNEILPLASGPIVGGPFPTTN